MHEVRPATLRISAYWSERAKAWDLVASGESSHGSWRRSLRAESHLELDETAGAVLLRALVRELESLLL